jgi:predicted phage terminase large subunit-like protein
MFVDCSFEDESTAIDPDPVVAQVWAWTQGAYYLVDQVREKLDIIGTCNALRDLRAKWPKITAIHVEKKANGAAVIRTLRDEVPGVKAWPPKGEPMPSKVERANAVQPLMTSCHFPPDAAWFGEYRAELLGFPLARHDDQVDGTTMALLVMHTKRGYGDSLARAAAPG